ncbi:hypothetical protein [Falsiroseomonas sp.]|uniref:hypothetical protein n=1 Tax=Falsiroseomonas sp. TaxID=2870721 RepID=UPI003F6F9BF0
MKSFLLLALTLTAACSATASSSSADDRRWINQCLRDNREARVSQSVVRAYCSCMNDRMSNNETRSITQWERANPRAREACERRSGWT